MKYWKYWLRCIPALILISAAQQQSEFILTTSVPGSVDFIRADHLGNLYTIHNSHLKKYNSSGILMAEFSRNSLGNFSGLDPSDPFKILLFSQSTGTILRLDNTLSQHGDPINLYHSNLYDPSLTCHAHDNGCWVFDQTLDEIIYVNSFGNTGLRTGKLTEILQGKPNLSMILEKDFILYASDPGKGIFLFDQYGTYLKNFPLKNIRSFSVSSGKIYWHNQNLINIFDTNNLLHDSLILPSRHSKNAILEGNHLMIQVNDSISIFQKKSHP